MNKIKIGDTVKVISNKQDYDNYIGATGAVIGITSSSVLIETRGTTLWFSNREIRLLNK